MKTLIVVLGPTGVGKTSLCLELAERYDTPIINADSRQIFKEIPIGTAAPTQEQQRRVKHYFVGNHHLQDYYNASMFENDVIGLLEVIFKDKDKVIMSGGSMMYIDAVCNGIDDIPSVDDTVRKQLQQKYEKEGLETIIKELETLDPEYALIVDRKNHKRVIHALEICLSTGNTYTSFRKNVKKTRTFNILKIGLNRKREELYERIDRRVDEMFEEGLLEEAKSVYPLKHLNSLNTVGYKELFDFLDGKYSLEEAKFKIKCNTHKYCRKQLTWFKRDTEIHWFSPEDISGIVSLIDSL